MRFNKLTVLLLSCTLFACSSMPSIPFVGTDKDEVEKTVRVDPATELAAVLRASDDKVKARFKHRHPAQTLAFFKVEPGMSVAEALPGGGWYSNILANYLGPKGSLHGINYNDDMWARFGFFNADAIAGRIASTKKFPELVAGFTDNGISSSGFTFATVPNELKGSLDRVLFIRALHNLSRFEKDAGTLTESLAATHALLKADGLVGVVQHRLPESAPEKGSYGSRGYLKPSNLIRAFERAGFQLIAESEVNANPNDNPSDSDIVWRLPPSLNGSRDKPEQMKRMQAIGESDRMTLLFKKK